MKPAFSIVGNLASLINRNLLITVAPWGISYVIFDEDKEVYALYVFHLKQEETHENFAAFIKDTAYAINDLQNPFQKIIVVYLLAEAILIPQLYGQQQFNRELLEMAVGNVGDASIRKDYAQQENLYVVYALPRAVENVIGYLFLADQVYHGYSIILNDRAGKENTSLAVVFGLNTMVVHLLKEGQLFLLQHFSFSTQEDVLYLLLKICQSHQLNHNEIACSFSGMIDKESKLFNLLQEYFQYCSFAKLPEELSYPQEIKKYPEQYFSHIFQMLQCV